MIRKLYDLLELAEKNEIKEHRFDNVELKAQWKQDDGKKTSMLANKTESEVAWLVVGIHDSGSVCGHDESWAKATELQVSQHLNQYLDPSQACKNLSCHGLQNGWIVVIQLTNPGTVVYWNKKAYKGKGTSIAEMSPREVMEYTVRLPGLADYTAQTVDFAPDKDLVRDYCTRLEARYPENGYKGITSHGAKEAIQCTGIGMRNAARILFGDFRFRLVRFDSYGQPTSNESTLGLYRLVSGEVAEGIQQWAGKLPSAIRSVYPAKALSEALANAVAHAAYFEAFGEVIVEQYVDHLVISNLCLPEYGYFANKWFSRSHCNVSH